MNVGFVIPAHGRTAVTRLACQGYAWLAESLAVRGITTHFVLVADDDNLSIADEHGFDTIEMPNILGAKINAGMQHVAAAGADWICFTGSDDWLHPDLFDDLPTAAAVVAGRQIAVVSLEWPRLRTLHIGSNVGAPPWLIHRRLLERTGFAPCEPERSHGIEGNLVRAFGRSLPVWLFRDPHDLCRVDFKTADSMTPYERVADTLGYGTELSPWNKLRRRYPPELVDAALDTALAVAA